MTLAKLPALVVTLGLMGAGALAVVAVDDRSSPPSAPITASAEPAEPLTLRCTPGTSPAAAPSAHPNDLIVGPLRLVGVLDAAREPGASWRRLEGRDPGWSTPVLLRSGATVTLRLPRSARRTAAFAYGTHRATAARVRDGVSAIRFRGCDRTAADGREATATSWPGAIVVSGRACVPIDITVGQGTAVRLELGMGRSDCRTRAAV